MRLRAHRPLSVHVGDTRYLYGQVSDIRYLYVCISDDRSLYVYVDVSDDTSLSGCVGDKRRV